MRSFWWIAPVVTLAGPVRAARAEGAPSVVVLPVSHDLRGDVGQVLQNIRGQVATALGEVGYEVIPPADTDDCGADDPGGGINPQHLASVAEACGLQAAAGLQIEASAMGYGMRFRLVAADGTTVADEQASCDFCTEGEMIERWSAVVAAAGPPPATLVAARAAPSPPPDDLPPPPPVEGGGGTGEAPESGAGFEIGDIPWWGWAGAGLSLATIAAGIPLLVIDGDGTCDGPLESCPEIYDTMPGGATMIALGTAGLGAVAVGLYLYLADDDGDEAEPPGDGDEPPVVDLAVLPGPGGLVVRGVFGF